MMSAHLRRPAIAAAVVVAVAVVAAMLVARSGAVQPLGPQHIAVAGPAIVAPDPLDATSWRLSLAPHPPLVCLSARRLGHRQNVGQCVHDRGQSWAIARLVEHPAPRTLVFGYARAGTRRVTVSGPSGARIFDLSRRGRVFLAVFSGRVSLRDLGVVATRADGSHTELDLGGRGLAYAPDPHHGPGWFAQAFRFTAGPRRGQTCVHVGREQPRYGATVSRTPTHPICSDLTGTQYFFKVVRFQGQTVLTGVAKRGVREISVRRFAGVVRDARLNVPIVRASGAFVAVFDGGKIHTDGLAITVRERLRANVFVGQRAMNLGFLAHIPPDLLRNAQSGRGRWLYHGLRITSAASTRHHLKCSSDLRICDDSMAALLRDALHQGVAQGGYTVSDANVCPLVPFDPLPSGAARAAAGEALREAPAIYGATNLTGARVVAVGPARNDRARGGYARVKCGRSAWNRTLVVYLEFPAMGPSASMSEGVVLVGRFWGQYRVWAQLH